MAAVLQFRRKIAPAGWANEELAEFYRIVDVMGRAGLAISVDVGVSDEGEPWVAFVREDTGDVLAHIARIDGWVVAVSAASNEVVRAQSLKEVVRRIVDTHPLVLLPAHRPGSHVHVHPCAVLAAFIAAAYMLAEGIQSEAHAREFAESVSADHAAATAAALAAPAPPKVAAHPNPLRGALTSIADFLRGVGDLTQPVSINTTTANAAIAAVVALVLSSDEAGVTGSHSASNSEASIIATMLAGAAASAAEAQGEAAARGAASQHVVSLDANLTDSELKADIARSQDRFVDAQPHASLTDHAAAAREHAAGEGVMEIAMAAQIKPLETVARPIADLSVAAQAAAAAVAAAEAASDRTSKPAASESISSAPATVAGASAPAATKSDFGVAASSASTNSTARSASTDVTADHSSLHSTGQSETTVLRLSDISKYALSALRITDALISALDQVKVSMLKADATDAAIVTTSSLTGDLSLLKTSDLSISVTPSVSSSTASTALASADLSSPVVKAPSSYATHIEATDLSTTSSSVVSTAASGVGSSASGSSAMSVATTSSTTTSTKATTTTASAGEPTASHASTAYDIITGILTFAFGDHHTFAANAAARADITQDLARHGMSTTSQRVLIFSSETVTVPVFELMPGVVLVDGQEIAKENRAPRALEITSESKVIYLPDGGTLNLIGVIDFSAPV